MSDYVTASGWAKGIFYSVLASIVGGASKLAIRKSWLLEQNFATTSETEYQEFHEDDIHPLESQPVTRDNNLYPNQSTSSSNNNVSINYLEYIKESCSCPWFSFPILLRMSGMIGMTFINPLFCVLAMNYASPSILAPFSGLTLVWIVLFSEMFIGEKPHKQQIFAASLIVSGEIIVAIWGDHTNDEGVSLDDIIQSYEDRIFQLYGFCMFLWLIFVTYLILYAKGTLKRFAWGVSGGSITGLQNFLKDSLTVLKCTKAEGSPLSLYFYIMMFSAIATSFSGLLMLTACMKRYDATFSSAMFVGSFVVSASIMSAVHYHTFQNLVGIWNFLMYPTGIWILIIGVYILVQTTHENGPSSEMVDTIRSDDDSFHFNAFDTCLKQPLCQKQRSEDEDFEIS